MHNEMGLYYKSINMSIFFEEHDLLLEYILFSKIIFLSNRIENKNKHKKIPVFL